MAGKQCILDLETNDIRGGSKLVLGLLNYPELLRQAIGFVLQAPWDRISLTSVWEAHSNGGINSCSFVGRMRETVFGVVLTLAAEDQQAALQPSPQCGLAEIPGTGHQELATVMQELLRQGFRVTKHFGGTDTMMLPDVNGGHITLTLGQASAYGNDAEGLNVKFDWGVWMNGYRVPNWWR